MSGRRAAKVKTRSGGDALAGSSHRSVAIVEHEKNLKPLTVGCLVKHAVPLYCTFEYDGMERNCRNGIGSRPVVPIM